MSYFQLAGMPQLTLLPHDAMRSVSTVIPQIAVKFADGFEDQIVLEHYSPRKNKFSTNACAYTGHLKTEPLTSAVAVTGCLHQNEKLDILIMSSHEKQYTTFTLVDGTFKFKELKQLEDVAYLPGDIKQKREELFTAKGANIEGRVPRQMKAKIRIFYDNVASKKIDNCLIAPLNISEFTTRVLANLQMYYKDASFNHTILFEVTSYLFAYYHSRNVSVCMEHIFYSTKI